MAIRWSNAVNATYWSLGWDRSAWYLTEMASGDPMPGALAFGEVLLTITRRLPLVEKLVKNTGTGLWNLGLGEDAVRRQAALRYDVSAAEARRRLVDASVAVLHDAGERLDTAGDSLNRPLRERQAAWAKILPAITKKLVWSC